MIINPVIAGGGIKEEDITAEFLQTLDPDFTADNIAEGVDLFGLVGTRPEGAKIATGRVTATSSDCKVTVTGLSFQPNNVCLIGGTGNIVASQGTTAYFIYGSSIYTRSCSLSYSNNGFSIQGHTWNNASQGYFVGTYYYVAWEA